MRNATEQIEKDTELETAEYLEAEVRSVLEHAVDAQRRGLKVYQSLQNLNEVIGTEYGDRVLYELIQNAHDAHKPGEKGRIAIKLVVNSETEGVLYIANGGTGFRKKDVEAVRNLATSAKEVGEGIGNKGLGFRSVEALTDYVQVFSQQSTCPADRFAGFCFRFAEVAEIEKILCSYGVDSSTSENVARTIPRYLVPQSLKEQPEEIMAYARRGYATVIVAPLRTEIAVNLAKKQVNALANLDVPLLLFLDRINEIRIDVEGPNQLPSRRRLQRRQTNLGDVPSLPGTSIHEVEVGEDRRFLVVRREVDKAKVRAAVERSIPAAPQLRRWLNWKGVPVVSVAVGLSMETVTKGRLYNFLPMDDEATSPISGYLDAPFFADIDRRNADLDLPLNETLMKFAAEACAAAALSIIERDLSVPRHAVFDLFAWTGDNAGMLDGALKELGSSLREVCFIPVIGERGTNVWSSLLKVSIWPGGSFAVLKDKEVAKHVGAQLISGDLDSQRIERLKAIARRIFPSLSLAPSGHKLAEWSETFARSLVKRKATPRTWSRFYDDLTDVFKSSGATLELLDGKEILFDRSGKLRVAGGQDDDERGSVFVRNEVPKGKRKKAGIPLPPATLARRYRFLDERVSIRSETLDAFVKAKLVRVYNPVEALSGLKSALSKNANHKRRRDALIWAFQVWRTASARLEEELQNADLYVPTLSGWHPAKDAFFSSSWTSVGRTLENYLTEAAEVSADCRYARDLLLVGQQDWPVAVQDSKGHWTRFLELIGVADGLRPIPARLDRKGTPVDLWNSILRRGKAADGFDHNWCAEVAHISFNHPYTEYRVRGEAWRLPGQLEHDALSESARETFCTLAFDHLKIHGTSFFHFEVGRFERYERDYDKRVFPTPLATFLRKRAWIAAMTQDGLAFRCPRECWASRQRRGGPPRFIDRIPEGVANFSEGDKLAELAFGKPLGLREWNNPETALDRLRDLAGVAVRLASNDRPTLRREYQHAWLDAVETGISLPNDLSLIVTRLGRFEILDGNPDTPKAVIVTEDAQRFEARVLSSAGQAVLEVGQGSTEKVAVLLKSTGTFSPRRIDGMGVQLFVDDEPFVPRSDDPLLTSLGLSWFPEVVVIGHELRGVQLERGIQSTTVDRRVRTIRVRRCEKISLRIDDSEVSSAEQLRWYAFEHDELPTLILTWDLALNWMTLADSLSGGIARLIDARLHSLEPLLLRLALARASDELEAPSDGVLARVLECDVQTVQDHRAALRTDLEHVLHLLIPIVAYCGGVDLSRQLQNDMDRAGAKFDARKWLELHLGGHGYSPDELIEACEQAANRGEMRKQLALDYERFNRVLMELGEAPLSNEAELRQLYEAYLGPMRPGIIDRLRRHYAPAFRNGQDLAIYTERKNMGFLAFDPGWILSRETLDMEVVTAHVSRLLDEALGPDTGEELAHLKRVVDVNRKLVRDFAEEAIPIVRVWCRQNVASIPEPWQLGESQAVVRRLENSGLLDFDIADENAIPTFCVRSGCWPEGMPTSLNKNLLGLDKDEVAGEEKRRERERQQREIECRSIKFAGSSLDTGDPAFAETLQGLAESWLDKDASWFERSRQRTRLIEFSNAGQAAGATGGGGKGGTTKQRERQLTDAQRQAMGLTSEWLALQFLRRCHGEFVDETCWISKNRARFFSGNEGDDSAGYDFLVKTPQVNWLYEVKSSLENSGEFELTANELRVASSASKDGRRRYRILYVPYVFSPDKWYVLTLPNPMGETTRNCFTMIGRGSVRLRFERQ